MKHYEFSEELAKAESDAEATNLAKKSDQMFVRSLDQLAEDSPDAKGRRLTAFEAVVAYGRDVLLEVLTEGTALLCESPGSAGQLIRERRELLSLSPGQTAARAKVPVRVVEEAEKSRRLPIREYERIARVLGLDERYVSVRAEPDTANRELAVRLRRIGDDHPRMSAQAVSAIAEAAWVALTQIRLEEQLGIGPSHTGIQPSSNYGLPGYPAYLHGYFLANDARERLGLGTGALPKYLRDLCEDVLGIPLIQAELGEHIAGVTVQVGERRAIVVNVTGGNRHVYVRRSTIAHELGHLLYDIEAELRELHVDDYDELEKLAEQLPDRVEQRANAFAVEFIAPQKAAVECYEKAGADPVGAVMDTFGISYTAARYQLWNGLDRRLSIEELVTERRKPDPSFESGEAYTADYHPIQGLPVPRAGRFSAVVLQAAETKLVSWQTAADYLDCKESQLRAASNGIRELFPTVFRRTR